MKPASIITILLGLCVVIGAAVLSRGGGSGGSGVATGTSAATARPPAGALALGVVTSPEKEALLADAVRRFNATGAQVGGRRVFASVRAMNSGDAEAALVKGRLRADVWSPASSFWGRLANRQADRELTPATAPSLVRTPLVVAMWEPMARALGWPAKRVGFAEITRLATAADGWASVGKPAFGAFRYVHTNPDSSTSGAEAVAASYFAATGKREGLTEADVRRAAPQVKSLERSIVHYGSDTLFIADQLCRGGMAYASAVAMEETTLLAFNRRRGCQTGGSRLVALYPREGSFYSDSPLYTLAAGAKAQGARALLAFLAKDVDAAKAGRFGFRPGNDGEAPAGLVVSDPGVDAKQPRRVLEVPTPQVLDRILATWRADRKPARLEVVIDTSGSMNEEGKLVRAKEGLQGFLKALAPQDVVGLTTFSSSVVSLVPAAPYRTNRTQLAAAVRDLVPEAETALRDAAAQSVAKVEKVADADHINAVVLLTDGEDTRSSLTEQQVVDRLRAAGRAESNRVRVFTIAYGSQPNTRELESYAQATGGKAFRASTSDIEQVYRAISSFF
jgi:Ca-activated chloride channel family protein